MTKPVYISYRDHRFRAEAQAIIAQADAILEEYAAQGYVLTLRQLYYQFVARALIRNTQRDYKRLGSIVNDARLAGLLPWNRLEDRTRNLQRLSSWDDPEDIVNAAAESFHVDWWEGQERRPEVWIEKDALIGVIEGVCEELDVPYFSCRGYTSQSEVWAAGQRFLGYRENGQEPVVFHLGDHDPSGLDMTRDIDHRLLIFTDHGLAFVDRLALSMEQINQYNPPPNPAKVTDTRFAAYAAQYGVESWELDALEPAVISDLIRVAVEDVRDDVQWQDRVDYENKCKATLGQAASRWEEVAEFLES